MVFYCKNKTSNFAALHYILLMEGLCLINSMQMISGNNVNSQMADEID